MTGKSSRLRATAVLAVLWVVLGTVGFGGAAAALGGAPAVDGHAPTVVSAVQYEMADGSPVIEVAFSEDITNASDIQVFVDDTRKNYSASEDATTPGRVVITGLESTQTGNVTVNVPETVRDTDGNPVVGLDEGNASVTYAPVTVTDGSESVGYVGSTVAVTNGTVGTELDITSSSDDVEYGFSGSTGDRSEVFLFETADREPATYEFDFDRDGTVDSTVELHDLNLTVSVAETNVTTGETITGTVSANAGGRTVELELLGAEGAVEATSTLDLSGQGTAEFEMPIDTRGQFSVEAEDVESGVTAESAGIRVEQAGDSTVDLPAAVVTEHRGDVAEITLDLERTDTATVTIGSDEIEFRGNATVIDDSGDGSVTLLFNTWAATGVPGGDLDTDATDVFAVTDGDTLAAADIDPENNVSSLLEPGEYDLSVSVGTEPVIDEPDAVGTLDLENRTGTMESMTAPSGEQEYSDERAVYAAISNGNLTSTNNISAGDVVVLNLSVGGLEGPLKLQDGANDTARFFSLLAGDARLTIRQRNSESGLEDYSLQFGESNVTVVSDPDNDTYFLAFDTDEVVAARNGTVVERSDGDQLRAKFKFDDEVKPSADYEITAPELEVDGPVVVANVENQTISGETTLAPGTPISIRIGPKGPTSLNYLKYGTVFVTENRTFAAAFDFDQQDVGEQFVVRVKALTRNDTLQVQGEVVEQRATSTPTATTTTTTTGATPTTTPPTETETRTDDDTPTVGTGADESSDEGQSTATGTAGALLPGDNAGAEIPSGGPPVDPGFGTILVTSVFFVAVLLAVVLDRY